MSRPTHALRTLARVATHPNPDRRPTARELADAMTDEVHGACLPAPRARAAADPGDPAAVDPLDALRLTDDEDEPVRFPRVAAAAAVLLVLAGVGFGLRPSAAAKASAKAPAAAPSTTPTTVATALPVATRLPAPPPGCAVVTGPLKADIDGDGCDDGLRFDDGVLHAGPTRWAVGQKGDVVVTGSWGCAPAATLALLRPATGDVFAFGGWAASGHPTAAPLVGHVDGANGLRPDDTDGDGCDDLVVTRSTGDAVTLHPKVPA
jgi:hypothetical protein